MFRHEITSKTSSNAWVAALAGGELAMNKLRKRLLLELANMRQDEKGLERFRKSIGLQFEAVEDNLLRSASGCLRRATSTPLRDTERMVNVWWRAAFEGAKLDSLPILPRLQIGGFVLHPRNFCAQFAAAIVENWHSFQKCGNPHCPAPYFLAKRRTQKYCERGACTAYAQRQYVKAWWDKEGRKRRARGQKGHMPRQLDKAS